MSQIDLFFRLLTNLPILADMNRCLPTFLCFLSFFACFSQTQAQVYPYEFRPDKQSSEGRRWGLVNANHEKITEPIFGLIDPFLNQEYNDYTKYYTNVDNPPGSQHPYHSVGGLIDKTGKVIAGVSGRDLVYDGNGRIAYILGDSLVTYFNLKTHKSFSRNRKDGVRHIARGSQYFLLLYNNTTNIATVINEHGKAWPVETQPYQDVEYIKTINQMPVYKVHGPRLSNTDLYYDGEGREVSEKKIYPEEEFWGVEESMEPEYGTLKSLSGTSTALPEAAKQKILSLYPDYTIGKPFLGVRGDIQLVEIKNKYDKIGLVDLNGKLILECAYTELKPLMSDFNDDKQDDKYYIVISIYSNSGMMNMDGDILLKPHFGFFQFNERYNLFSLMAPNGYSGYCDGQGNLFLPKECGCLGN